MKYLPLFISFHLINSQFSFATHFLNVECNEVCTCVSNVTITCPSGVEMKLINNNSDFDVRITCNKLHSELSDFTDLNITVGKDYLLIIEGCNLSNVSLPDLLDGIGLKGYRRLKIKNYRGMSPVQIRELLQQTNVPELCLINNTVNNFLLEPGCFADLRNLYELHILHHNLKSVPGDAFARSKNISSVILRYTLISTFQENTFSDLDRIFELVLSHNQISHLPERLFSRTRILRVLNLSHNLLTNIEPKLFSHLSQLSDLKMSHNKLKYISGEQFSQLTSLSELDLSHNQLISLAQDPLLSDLDRSVFYNCRELDELYLQNNSLTEVYDDWRIPLLTKLYKVNLTHNNISDLQAFNITYDMISIKDGTKKISAVDMETYDWVYYRTVVLIHNNPLNCDCEAITALENVSQYFTTNRTLLDNAKCRTPKKLENVRIVDIDWSPEYERCKQQALEKNDKCPEGCRCVYRPLTRSSVINCQYSDLQTYPRTLPVAPDANHTELNLYGNRLREFRLPDDPGYKNVTFLNLANNSLSTLDISGVSMRLKKLDLRHNNLNTLNEETLELLENAGELERLELADNPWICDLRNYRLAKLVYDKKQMIWHNVTCEDGYHVGKILDLYYSRREKIIIYVAFSVVGIILIALFILTVLYYRNRKRVLVYCFSSRWKVLRWLVSHPEIDDDDKLYDAFISFSHGDEMFVRNYLVPYLEETEERRYELCLHYRDWIPGEQILSQIGRSVRSSRRTIVVLSPNFLRSVWGVAEFRIALAEALRDGTARVIVILYQNVAGEEVDELLSYLHTNTYVKWGSPWFWEQLTYALPHPPVRQWGSLHYFSWSGRSRGAS